MDKKIAIIGSSGAIGGAFTRLLIDRPDTTILHSFSRGDQTIAHDKIIHHQMDYENESTIAAAALKASNDGPLDMVIAATGILHGSALQPEKALKDLSADKFECLFRANTIFPALVAKHFIPLLHRDRPSVFAALSARVGSISDNHLGGWYAYRASKAALNMIIKTTAIEVARRNKMAVIVGLHPGTVDSALSKPFQGNVPKEKLFTADYSAQRMLEVLAGLTPANSGRCFAWDGDEINP